MRDQLEEVVGKNVRPSLEQKHQLPYMEATVMELLRYISHVPILLPHATMCDTQINGYNLPKGTQVSRHTCPTLTPFYPILSSPVSHNLPIPLPWKCQFGDGFGVEFGHHHGIHVWSTTSEILLDIQI